MKFEGVLSVEVSQERNRAGQYPLTIVFEGKEGVSLQVLGARVVDQSILDPVAVISGKYFRHTAFSPALQLAIIKGGSEEAKTSKVEQDDYQRRTTEMMEQRRKRAIGE